MRAPVVALATTSLLILGAGAANAAPTPQDGDPIGNLLGQVGQVVQQVTKPLTQPIAPAPAAPAAPAAKPEPIKKLVETVTKPLTKPLTKPVSKPATTSSTAGAPAPAGGNTASSTVGKVVLGDTPVAGVSGNQSNAGNGSSSAYADLLSLGGYSIIGSQASSDGSTTTSGPVPANPLCMATGGALCAGLLYADSAAAADGSQADTKTGVADICLGGSDPTGDTCDGLHLGLAQGTSSVVTNPAGANTSTSWTSLVNLCLSGDDGCDVSANAVESTSGSGTGTPEAGKPTLGMLDLFGTKAGLPDDPIHTDVPKNCTEDFLCTVLNAVQAGSGTSDDQTVANADGLAGNLGATLGNASTGSTAPGTATPPADAGPAATGPDFASGTLEHLQLADNPVLDLSKNESTGTSDETAGHAVLLGALGAGIIGSDAASDGTTSASGPIPGNPLCDASGGALCLDLLYADSAASTSPTAADASTKTGVADLCLGGDDSTGATCSGIDVGLGQGESNLHKDKTTGQTQASSSTSLANLCLAGDAGCTVSADAVASDGKADSATGTSGSSTLADLGLDGTAVGAPADPIDVSVPTDCVDPGLVCLLLNQGDAGVGGNVASASQSVLEASGLGDTVGLGLAASKVQASSAIVEPPVVEPPVVVPPVVKPPVVEPPAVNAPNVSTPKNATTKDATTSPSAVAGVLPNTGGVWGGLLGLAMLLLVGGAAVLLGHRRRTA